MSNQVVDYDLILQANLIRVFSERDEHRRAVALRDLYAEDAVLYEPQACVTGHAAISDTVTSLLNTLPEDFVFTATGPALGHHGLGRLQWHGGPAGGAAIVRGMDIAHIKNNLIQSLYVFLETQPGQSHPDQDGK